MVSPPEGASSRVAAALAAATAEGYEVEGIDVDLSAEAAGSQIRRSDLAVVPNHAVPRLSTSGVIRPLPKAWTTADDWLPAIAASLIRGPDGLDAMPLAVRQLGLWRDPAASDDDGGVDDWEAYDRFATETGGRVAEPTAAGWAAWSFLNRLPSASTTWLFGRQSFRPNIDAAFARDALTLMMRTVRRRSGPPMDSDAVLDHIVDGTLVAGVAEMAPPDPPAGLVVEPLPSAVDGGGVLVDPAAPSIVLPTGCRQTARAKGLARWWVGIRDDEDAGGDGFGSGRKWRQPLIRSTGGSAGPSPLTESLRTPVVRPTLRIVRGDEYYNALDEEIRVSLHEGRSAEDSLSAVADRWRSLTQRTGASVQLRHWR